jgi:uncharacterized RDD family membrane protein YckC
MPIEAVDRVLSDQQLKDHWVRRGIAYIVDTILIFIVTVVFIAIGFSILFGMFLASRSSTDFTSFFLIITIIFLIAMIFPILYWIILDAKGGTLGKRIMKLKPQAEDGKVGFSKSAVRNLSKIVGGIVGGFVGGLFIALAIEFIIVGVDAFLGINKGGDPRMKYTDYLAKTTVVRTDVKESFAPYVPKEQAPSPSPPSPTAEATTAVTQTSTIEGATMSTAPVASKKEKKFPVIPVIVSIGIVALIIMLAILGGVISPQPSENRSSSGGLLTIEKNQWEDIQTMEGDIAGGGPLTMVPDVTVPFEVGDTVYQMDILLTWNPQTMDLDLIVRDPSGTEQGTSGNSPGTPESIRIKGNIDPGTWTAEIDPFAAVNVHFTLEVTCFNEIWNVSGDEGELIYMNSESPTKVTMDQMDAFDIEKEYNMLLIQMEISPSEGSCGMDVSDPEGNIILSGEASGSETVFKEDYVDSALGTWTVNFYLQDFTGTFIIQVIGM